MERISRRFWGILLVVGIFMVSFLSNRRGEFVYDAKYKQDQLLYLAYLPRNLLLANPLLFLAIAVVLILFISRIPAIRTVLFGETTLRNKEIGVQHVASSSTIHEKGKVFFGGRKILLDRSFLYVGVPGSGKTLQLKMLLGEILTDLNAGDNQRIFIREYKRGDFRPIVHAAKVPYKVIDPVIPGTYAWDIAKDCFDDAACDDIAETLIPSDVADHEFFGPASKTVIGEVLKGLRAKHGTEWSFTDFFQIVSDKDAVLEVASWTLTKGRELDTVILKAASSGDSLATVIVRLTRTYKTIAAAWVNSPKLSLSDFMKSNEVLILGFSLRAEVAMNAISTAITERLIAYALEKPEIHTKNFSKTFFILDELGNMSRVPKYGHLLRLGRSKGAFPISSLQDIGSFISKYPHAQQDEARSIIGIHNYTSISECELHTAKYYSEVLGELELERDTYSTQTALTGKPSMTRSTERFKRTKLEPFELITEMRRASLQNGISGYFLGHENDFKTCWKAHIPGSLLKKLLPEEDQKVKDGCAEETPPIPSLYPFTQSDYQRLRLTMPKDLEKEVQPIEEDDINRNNLLELLVDFAARLRFSSSQSETISANERIEVAVVWESLYPGTPHPENRETILTFLQRAIDELRNKQIQDDRLTFNF